MENSLVKGHAFLVANRPVLMDTLVDLSEVESGIRVEGKVYPVLTLHEETSLEKAFGSTRDIEYSNISGRFAGAGICDWAFVLVSNQT